MPINPLILQRRHAELGRIRLGIKTPISNGKTRPEKLDRFRFTSPSRPLIDAIATLYGGTARPWDNDGKAEHEVITDATSIPVIVVKGGLSQWLEAWSGGGCIHRCDGERNVLTDAPCDLEEMVQVGRERINPHTAAKPTTRLSVMLRDVESLGVWRLESKGWNAAAEIPAMAELAMYVGDLVPATLHLVERRAVRDGKTSRFVVPVLDLAVSKQRLVELVGGGAATPLAISEPAQGPAAIAAAKVDIDHWIDLLADATTPDECRAIWAQAGQSGGLTPELQERIKVRAAECAADQVAAGPQSAAESGAESGFDPRPAADTPGDIDDIWFRVVAAAGAAGIGDRELREEFASSHGHPVEVATFAELSTFLVEVRSMASEGAA